MMIKKGVDFLIRLADAGADSKNVQHMYRETHKSWLRFEYSSPRDFVRLSNQAKRREVRRRLYRNREKNAHDSLASSDTY